MKHPNFRGDEIGIREREVGTQIRKNKVKQRHKNYRQVITQKRETNRNSETGYELGLNISIF